MKVTNEELLKNTIQGKLGELITGAEEIAKQAVEMMRTSSSLLVWGEAVKRMAENTIDIKDRLDGMTYRELEDLHAAVRNEMQRRLKEEPCNYEEGPYNRPQK